MAYMTENFHTHTTRCHHASGTEEEYILQAIAAGVKTLGFSDHVPLPEKADGLLVNHIRMEMSQAKGYVKTLKALKEKYKDQITILIGYEAEYFDEYVQDQLEQLKKIGYDYLILGQHYLLDYGIRSYCGLPSFDEQKLKDYVDVCIRALQTKEYLFLAHPDLMNYIGSEEVYRIEMERLCRFCRMNHVPLELNIHGKRLNRYYPSKQFFQIAADMGNQFVLGIDAHSPEEIGDQESYEATLQFAQECGITEFISLAQRFEK